MDLCHPTFHIGALLLKERNQQIPVPEFCFKLLHPGLCVRNRVAPAIFGFQNIFLHQLLARQGMDHPWLAGDLQFTSLAAAMRASARSKRAPNAECA